MSGPDDVALLINGREFAFWSELELHLSLDSYSQLSFRAPFEPARSEFRETFEPFSYKPLQVTLGGKPLFNGTLIGVNPKTDADSRTVEVTGYSLPGVLHDCDAPGVSLPIVFRKMDLRAITKKLTEPFGIGVEFRDPPGSPFDLVRLACNESIQKFLANLAYQRGLVISNTEFGDVLFWRTIAPGKPVVTFAEGTPPVTDVEARFNAQDYFSEITGYAKGSRRRRGAKYTLQNPWLRSPLRCKSFTLEDTERGDAPDATRAKAGRMFGNMVTYTVSDLPTWRDPHDALWAPNTTLLLTAPGAMVYEQTELCVRRVALKQSAERRSATLELVLPGSFSGEVPASLPWKRV